MRAPPPEIANQHSPPRASRSFEYTSLSATACFAFKISEGPPLSRAWLYSLAVASAKAKIALGDLSTGFRLACCAVTNFFEDTRNTEDGVGLVPLELSCDGGKVRPVRLRRTSFERREGHRAGQYVRERQEGQDSVSRNRHLADRCRENPAHLGQEVAVREDASLGTACGAGSVDE